MLCFFVCVSHCAHFSLSLSKTKNMHANKKNIRKRLNDMSEPCQMFVSLFAIKCLAFAHTLLFTIILGCIYFVFKAMSLSMHNITLFDCLCFIILLLYCLFQVEMCLFLLMCVRVCVCVCCIFTLRKFAKQTEKKCEV